jgi:hypothetical protein
MTRCTLAMAVATTDYAAVSFFQPKEFRGSKEIASNKGEIVQPPLVYASRIDAAMVG